jgi:hypothetical protein
VYSAASTCRAPLTATLRQKKVSRTVPPLDRYLPLWLLFFCRMEYGQLVPLVFFLAKLASAYELLETW